MHWTLLWKTPLYRAHPPPKLLISGGQVQRPKSTELTSGGYWRSRYSQRSGWYASYRKTFLFQNILASLINLLFDSSFGKLNRWFIIKKSHFLYYNVESRDTFISSENKINLREGSIFVNNVNSFLSISSTSPQEPIICQFSGIMIYISMYGVCGCHIVTSLTICLMFP